MSPNASLPTLAYPSFVTLARGLSGSVDFVGGSIAASALRALKADLSP